MNTRVVFYLLALMLATALTTQAAPPTEVSSYVMVNGMVYEVTPHGVTPATITINRPTFTPSTSEKPPSRLTVKAHEVYVRLARIKLVYNDLAIAVKVKVPEYEVQGMITGVDGTVVKFERVEPDSTNIYTVRGDIIDPRVELRTKEQLNPDQKFYLKVFLFCDEKGKWVAINPPRIMEKPDPAAPSPKNLPFIGDR